jgi:hypothetical protein
MTSRTKAAAARGGLVRGMRTVSYLQEHDAMMERYAARQAKSQAAHDRRVRAFRSARDRLVRAGDPPPEYRPWPTEMRTKLRAIERQIAASAVERVVAMSHKGIAFSRGGSRERTGYTSSDIDNMLKAGAQITLTHNHPKPMAHSPSDVATFLSTGLFRQTRVVESPVADVSTVHVLTRQRTLTLADSRRCVAAHYNAYAKALESPSHAIQASAADRAMRALMATCDGALAYHRERLTIPNRKRTT